MGLSSKIYFSSNLVSNLISDLQKYSMDSYKMNPIYASHLHYTPDNYSSSLSHLSMRVLSFPHHSEWATELEWKGIEIGNLTSLKRSVACHKSTALLLLINQTTDYLIGLACNNCGIHSTESLIRPSSRCALSVGERQGPIKWQLFIWFSRPCPFLLFIPIPSLSMPPLLVDNKRDNGRQKPPT